MLDKIEYVPRPMLALGLFKKSQLQVSPYDPPC
jgi:hypothetical protein